MSKHLLLVAAATLVLFASKKVHAEAYGSGWYGEIQVSYSHEDNISRSFWSGDEVSDDVLSTSIGGGYSSKIGNTGELVFYGYVNVNTHDEYEDLDNIATSIGISYTFQPNPGYDTVWYNTESSLTHFSYDNSEAREGLLFNLDLNANKRIGNKTAGHLGYRYADVLHDFKSQKERERDAAFDTTTHEIYIGIDREIMPFVYLYGEYAFRHGDTWSNQSFDAGLVEYDAETIDRVFDECAPDDFRCQPRYAGRTVSDAHMVNLGVVFQVKTINVDLSTVYYEAEGDNGQDYKNWLLSAGLIWNF